MFKVNNINRRTRCEICSKLTTKTTERQQRRRLNAGWVGSLFFRGNCKVKKCISWQNTQERLLLSWEMIKGETKCVLGVNWLNSCRFHERTFSVCFKRSKSWAEGVFLKLFFCQCFLLLSENSDFKSDNRKIN